MPEVHRNHGRAGGFLADPAPPDERRYRDGTWDHRGRSRAEQDEHRLRTQRAEYLYALAHPDAWSVAELGP